MLSEFICIGLSTQRAGGRGGDVQDKKKRLKRLYTINTINTDPLLTCNDGLFLAKLSYFDFRGTSTDTVWKLNHENYRVDTMMISKLLTGSNHNDK